MHIPEQTSSRGPKMLNASSGHLGSPRSLGIKYQKIQRPAPLISDGAKNLVFLPDEVLQIILEILHQQDNPMTPLMRVCTSLRDLIVKSPRLWRRILVSVDLMPASLRCGSTMSCRGEEMLRICVDRARSVPIEATLVIGQITDESPSAAVRAERYKIILEKSAQITFLCVIINPGTELTEVIESFRYVFNSGFESLESLMIASAVPLSGLINAFGGLLDWISATSTKLRSLYLENVSKDFVMEARERPFWRGLSRVTLKGEYQPLHAAVFKQCENLDFLSFSGELLANWEDAPPLPAAYHPLVAAGTQLSVNPLPPATPPHPTRPIDVVRNELNEKRHELMLSHLQWIRVGAITMYGLSQLVTPHVRFLVIGTALRDYTKAQPAPHSVIFPEVEVLHISSVHSHISCIVAPKLQTLCLQIQVLKKSDANAILQDVFDGHPQMLKPENLSLSALAHDKYLVSMLKKLRDIKTLTLILQDQPKKAIFDALKKSTFVPALTSFTLDLQSTTEKNLGKRQKYIKDRMEEVQAAPVRKGLIWLSAKWAAGEQVFVQCEKCGTKTTEISG